MELIFLQTPHFDPFVPGSAAMIFLQSELPSSRNTTEMREFHARLHSSARPPFCGCLSNLLPADLVCWSRAARRQRPYGCCGPYANSAIGCKHGFSFWWPPRGIGLHIQTLLPGVCLCFLSWRMCSSWNNPFNKAIRKLLHHCGANFWKQILHALLCCNNLMTTLVHMSALSAPALCSLVLRAS